LMVGVPSTRATSKRGNAPWQRIVSLSTSATKISTHFAKQLLYDFSPKCVTATA
jgi:hypothetical protein